MEQAVRKGKTGLFDFMLSLHNRTLDIQGNKIPFTGEKILSTYLCNSTLSTE